MKNALLIFAFLSFYLSSVHASVDSADADKCRVSGEAEVAAVGAGGGEFVNLFRFVSGMCDVEFLKFFGYHGGMFYFGS